MNAPQAADDWEALDLDQIKPVGSAANLAETAAAAEAAPAKAGGAAAAAKAEGAAAKAATAAAESGSESEEEESGSEGARNWLERVQRIGNGMSCAPIGVALLFKGA